MSTVVPFSLKDAPALIERLLPVQKLSAEVYKERMAGAGQTLTALGSYWKGRKPLILNKACILGCLLPATGDDKRDLEIFELLMGMDREALTSRLEAKNDKLTKHFLGQPNHVQDSEPYRTWVSMSARPEECGDELFDPIWTQVNQHLGTEASSFPELVEQLGIMRYGKRPTVADTFCGSGQIPFEAARLGCDVYASDLNPIACMLTWGAFHLVGSSREDAEERADEHTCSLNEVEREISLLGIDDDGDGWRAKVFLYCVEVKCPQSGWKVPLLSTLVVSQPRTGERNNVILRLRPIPAQKRYDIEVVQNASEAELSGAAKGTVRSDGRGQDPFMVHSVDGKEYRTKISTLRGDYRKPDGGTGNKLRQWEVTDFKPREVDIFQERLYCVQWMRPKPGKKKQMDYEFRSVTQADLARERKVEEYVDRHLAEWQSKGWIPDMRIEPGAKTDEPIRTRGWTHWHHLFTARQLLVLGLAAKTRSPRQALALAHLANWNSRLSTWNRGSGGGGSVQNTFINQALNTLFDFGARGWDYSRPLLELTYPSAPQVGSRVIESKAAAAYCADAEVLITDPPYGDAVHYEEILDFFIAWLRRNPPEEFKSWVWDSRRALAVKGSGEDFRQGMVAAYRRMNECMPDNGIQVIMFTHQSGSIWADMANIVWASGLQVTAAWYVVTETDSALREGSYVKGTVLLVLRKRAGNHKISRDDLAWEIQEEVEEQVATLTGLNQQAKGLYRDENVFEDADIQMAGYAAALRVLTKYATIDGRDMPTEALRPRVKGEKTFVDGLIEFAVATANQCLVPGGIEKHHWDKLSGAERFYLKMLDLEARGAKTLDNYQNFAKAFKVRDFNAFLASSKANSARLKSAVEFGRAEMGESSEFHQSVLRASLYAMMEIVKNVPPDDVLAHLRLNVPNWYDSTQRELVAELSGYMAKQLEAIRPEEASAARVLRELVKNERLG